MNHNIFQIDFVGKGGASPKLARPDSARSGANTRNHIVDPTMIPGQLLRNCHYVIRLRYLPKFS